MNGLLFHRRFGDGLVKAVLDPLTEDPILIRSEMLQKTRGEVKMYMLNKDNRAIMRNLGLVLGDLSEFSSNFTLPESEEELARLLVIVERAVATQQPINIYTSFCPDWSRNSRGEYDFKRLGCSESYIAKKYFANITPLFRLLAQHHVPYSGVLLFADWGLETEITTQDTYGTELSSEDIQICFQSTLALTDQHLLKLQNGEQGNLFANCFIQSMTQFLAESDLDLASVGKQMRQFFLEKRSGKRLLDILNKDSLPINEARLGLSEEQNRDFMLQGLVEYATLAQTFSSQSLIVACESRTTSRTYNLPKHSFAKLPLFYIKGNGGVRSGVNIL